MFADRFPENAPAKLVHVAKPSRFKAGLVRKASCGRMVNLMAMGDLETVTCPRCAIAALTAPSTSSSETPDVR